MASTSANNWLAVQSLDSRYEDIEGTCYEYPCKIPNAQRIKSGDVVLLAIPQHEAPDNGRLIGIGQIGTIRRSPEEHYVAYYNRYLAVDPARSFEEIGGDPRRNPRNSINKIDDTVIERFLALIGLSKIEELPSISIDPDFLKMPPEDDLRNFFHKAVTDDLLGPAGGPEEEIVGSSVRDRYLVGKLAPKRVTVDPAASEERESNAGDDSEDGVADESEPAHESLMPSSFGMTFCVSPEAEQLEIEASWGSYERVTSEVFSDKDGNFKRAWKRMPSGITLELPIAAGEFGPILPDPDLEDIYIRGSVRVNPETGDWIVSVFLVNEQEEPKQAKDAAWLFQPEIIARAPGSAPVFTRRSMAEWDSGDDERQSLEMLYRDQVEFAVGHGVSVHAALADGKTDRAIEVRTRVIPSYDVPKTVVPTTEDIPGISGLILDMKDLAEIDQGTLIASLRILSEEYSEWITRESARLDAGELGSYEPQARASLERCSEVQRRLVEGIDVLETNSTALEAFRFANRTMWKQRVHGIYSLERRRGGDPSLATIDVPGNRSWYPFQLAFVLLGIPSLIDPLHKDRTETGSAVADLLWYPTGGGKTEAYFGLAAFAMAIRRLQGSVSDLDASRGVAVIMRYTLRLLTIQQFQRASTLICAMELVRREDPVRWGVTPFRLGLWVGQRATPNTTDDACRAIENAHGDSWRKRGTGTPEQLTNCPWCGREIKMGNGDLECRPFKGNVGRTLTFCSDKKGRCEFSRAKSPDEGIPVVVVDEEIYRLLPAMLIGTVDKFAQMPWKGEVQTLFGRVAGECPRHGFISPDSEEHCTGQHNKKGSLPRTTRLDCQMLRPPDLVIQDEFHLISGPLGTLVGLYETAIDELSGWSHDGTLVRPKVVASTATVRRAREQTHAVFLRNVNVFPPHGLDVGDNFFSVQRPVSPEMPGRRYIGICAPGVSRPAVLIRVYTAVLAAAQRLWDLYGEAADPWMTLIGYFNSLRELGGMRRLVEDDVRTRAFRIAMSDLDRPGLAQRDIREVEELTSRAASSDIPRILDWLEVKFSQSKEDSGNHPLDVALATNMLSVGVDVQRLGLMVVNGQPKTTAEYIQASSRVGRRHPGLICTVLNWSRPRDLSHYETFEHYHATFYQQVEAQSVTPFAPRSVDRGLTGVLTSLVRLSELDLNPNAGAGQLTQPDDHHAEEASKAVVTRSWSVTQKTGVRDLVQRALGTRVDEWVKEASEAGRVLGYKGKKDGSTVGLLKAPGSSDWDLFTTPTSMREVEPPVSLILQKPIPRTGKLWAIGHSQDSEQGEEA